MAQGDIITTEVEEIIAKVWEEHALNGWTSKEIQSEVANRVQEKWPGRYKQDWPGLRAVQARLPGIKDKFNSKEFQDLEAPWHLGALENYPLPSEAIPFILMVQSYAKNYPDPVLKTSLDPVSIRQAKWIARLYPIVGDLVKKKKPKDNIPRAAAFLYHWSKVYTKHEVVCDLARISFDTYELDQGLRKGYWPMVVNNQWILFNMKDRTLRVDPLTAQQLANLEKDGEK